MYSLTDQEPILAIVTYNVFPVKNGVYLIEGTPTLILAETFRRNDLSPIKSPKYVIEADGNFQQLLSCEESIQKVIQFIGKKSSGSFDIIELVSKFFPPPQVLYVDCPHDSVGKKILLEGHGISLDPNDEQYIHFGYCDPCDEVPLLEGLMLKYARSLTKQI